MPRERKAGVAGNRSARILVDMPKMSLFPSFFETSSIPLQILVQGIVSK